MVLLIFSVIFFAAYFIFEMIWKEVSKKRSLYRDDHWSGIFSAIFFVVFCSFAGTLIFSIPSRYTGHQWDNEDYIALEEQEVILKEKAEVLTKQFSGYLAEKYPKFEKEMFLKILDADLLLIQFPELKTSESLISLVEKIKSLQDQYYEIIMLKVNVIKEMRKRIVNIWFLNILPRYSYLEGITMNNNKDEAIIWLANQLEEFTDQPALGWIRD